MSPIRYAVTHPLRGLICENKHCRGLSRGYAVTRPSKCVRVCVREEGIGRA
jgi:hypothetical protein